MVKWKKNRNLFRSNIKTVFTFSAEDTGFWKFYDILLVDILPCILKTFQPFFAIKNHLSSTSTN